MKFTKILSGIVAINIILSLPLGCGNKPGTHSDIDDIMGKKVTIGLQEVEIDYRYASEIVLIKDINYWSSPKGKIITLKFSFKYPVGNEHYRLTCVIRRKYSSDFWYDILDRTITKIEKIEDH
ncbi:hypothetical protein ACFL27_17425 [candidate division CSSED10-310 bacterium]|uniref:Uncharacterized protein n=1 Tax=candidate division CSSED10-310 bacterium TaxID=2855610 RepID=A0ABV6Z0K4_UNCC1